VFFHHIVQKPNAVFAWLIVDDLMGVFETVTGMKRISNNVGNHSDALTLNQHTT
jgi:hypothetical protein